MLLDKDFRDIANHMKTIYGLITKMPTCSQEKLTTFEANHTRFVTKCRWPVESVNGVFKTHFKSLEKCRNTQLPHIMDD